MIGRKILHYRILEKLGQGGMGIVYKAEDTKLDRTVALKFLPAHVSASEEQRTRFITEAKAAALLNHPNIATVYAIEEADDELFIVFEYIDGKELKEILGATGDAPLSVDKVIDYAIQIADGLRTAHEKGVTHRDIKSGNIMITDRGKVKITDFGLAKLTGGAQVTMAGTTVGTAAYMSPEQARGGEVDHRSDIWSFGVVLYEMLSGRLPFGGDYEQAVTYSVMHEEPEPLSMAIPLASDVFQHIVQKAMAKSPQERYQHIDEMLADLREIESQLRTSMSVEPSKKKRHSKRKRILVYGSLAVGIILVALLGPSFFPEHPGKIDSIAVLPLDNLSGDPGDEYFSAGMHEALITELSKISALRVISRTSVMRYKGTAKSMTEIAKELDVDAVVEGSALHSGDKVRITVQLIGTAPERHLWAQSFDRDLVDVLSLHSEVACRIAEKIQARITQDEEMRLKNRRPVNPAAYEEYLLGRHYRGISGAAPKTNLWKAVEHFERAITIDTTFALGYAGLAFTYYSLGPNYSIIAPEDSWPMVRRYAAKAVALDADLAEAHDALALVKIDYEWDWMEGEREFKRALELDPNSVDALLDYGYFLEDMGRTEEAIGLYEKVQRLDPYSDREATLWILYYTAGVEEAIQYLRDRIASDPENPIWYWRLAQIYAQEGRYSEAIEMLHIQIPLQGDDIQDEIALLGYLHGREGREEDALEMLEQLDELSARGLYVSPVHRAWIYSGLRDHDKAIEWLVRGYETRAHRMGLGLLGTLEFIYDPIRNDNRFQELLLKMNLPS